MLDTLSACVRCMQFTPCAPRVAHSRAVVKGFREKMYCVFARGSKSEHMFVFFPRSLRGHQEGARVKCGGRSGSRRPACVVVAARACRETPCLCGVAGRELFAKHPRFASTRPRVRHSCVAGAAARRNCAQNAVFCEPEGRSSSAPVKGSAVGEPLREVLRGNRRAPVVCLALAAALAAALVRVWLLF